MTTFARIIDGFAVDVCITPPSLEERFHPEWLARQTFIVVPDGTLSGAVDNGDGTFTNPPVPDTSPKPNNPGNPYFGKSPLPTKDFYALIGRALSPSRYARLRSDAAFLWIQDALTHVDIVDPDDKAGQFLGITGYLTSMVGSDGQLLMTTAERDAIMAAWK